MHEIYDYNLDIVEFSDPTDASLLWRSTSSNRIARVSLDSGSHRLDFDGTSGDFAGETSMKTGVDIIGAGGMPWNFGAAPY